MALFTQELRKIWRPAVLGAVLLLGLLYYYLFPSFYIDYFCNGPTAQASFDLAAGWVEQYGPTMEPEERQELDGQLAGEIAAFSQQIQAIPEAAARGLDSYEAFQTYHDTYYAQARANGGQADMEEEEFLWKVMNNTNYFVINDLENYMTNYDWKGENPWNQQESFAAATPAQQGRILTLETSPRGFLPNCVTLSTVEYAKDLAVWIVLGAVLLLSPTLVRDRLHRTRALQWSSRRGRKVLHTQLAAGLVSALVFSLASLALYAIPFLGKGPLRFRACPLFNWCRGDFTWFSLSYGQYLLLLVGMLLALGLAAGGLTLFLSQYSGNYVAMLLKAIPLFLVVGALAGTWLLDRPGYFRPWTENGTTPVPPDGPFLILAVLLVLAFLLCAWTCRRQRRREL